MNFNNAPELEFFLFRMSEEGKPTTAFQDDGGYLDLALTDHGGDVFV